MKSETAREVVSESGRGSSGLSLHLANAELGPLLRDRLQLTWNALSPFAEPLAAYTGGARGISPELAVQTNHPLFPPMAAILTHPDVRISHRYGGQGIEQFTAYARRASGQESIVVLMPTEGGQLLRYFDSGSAYFAWWLSRLASPAETATGTQSTFNLPSAALGYWLHALDMYRRQHYQHLLDPSTDDCLPVTAFVEAMNRAVASRDLRWLLPAYLLLTPGLSRLALEPRAEHLKWLADHGLLVPGKHPQSGEAVFHFGDALARLGTEFCQDRGTALGIEIAVNTERGPLPVFTGFLAPTPQANHLFEIEPGLARHQALTQRQLYARLVGLLSAALHPLSPELALRRASEPPLSTPAPRPAPDPTTEAATISCPACGRLNPSEMIFCGYCASRLIASPAEPAPSAPSRPAATEATIDQIQAQIYAAVQPAYPAAASLPVSPMPANGSCVAAGQASTVRQWFRQLSLSPRLNFRFHYDPPGSQRVVVVECPGAQVTEFLIDIEQVLDLARLLRRLRDSRHLPEAEFKALHALLRLKDVYGEVWTVGLGSLRWNRLEVGRWVPGEAPKMILVSSDLLQAALRKMPTENRALIQPPGAQESAKPAPSAATCPACRAALRPGLSYCTTCGAKI